MKKGEIKYQRQKLSKAADYKAKAQRSQLHGRLMCDREKVNNTSSTRNEYNFNKTQHAGAKYCVHKPKNTFPQRKKRISSLSPSHTPGTWQSEPKT